jgi:hypothetical protein
MSKTISVDDFPAGPRLDAEVARILGWTELRKMEHCDDWKGKPPDGPWYVIPRYSTDIGAVWKLVEGWPAETITVQRCSGRAMSLYGWSADQRWQAGSSWHPDGDVDRKYLTKGPTAPLAITRAFLKSNGVGKIEVENQGGQVETSTLAPTQATEGPRTTD